MFWVGLLKLRPEEDHHAVLEEVVVLYRVGVHSLCFVVMEPNNDQLRSKAPMYHLETYSFSGMSTWKQMMSPSWISLCVNVSFGFMSSIIPGLISYIITSVNMRMD